MRKLSGFLVLMGVGMSAAMAAPNDSVEFTAHAGVNDSTYITPPCPPDPGAVTLTCAAPVLTKGEIKMRLVGLEGHLQAFDVIRPIKPGSKVAAQLTLKPFRFQGECEYFIVWSPSEDVSSGCTAEHLAHVTCKWSPPIAVVK